MKNILNIQFEEFNLQIIFFFSKYYHFTSILLKYFHYIRMNCYIFQECARQAVQQLGGLHQTTRTHSAGWSGAADQSEGHLQANRVSMVSRSYIYMCVLFWTVTVIIL